MYFQCKAHYNKTLEKICRHRTAGWKWGQMLSQDGKAPLVLGKKEIIPLEIPIGKLDGPPDTGQRLLPGLVTLE